MKLLKQSTSVVIPFGPFVSPTDAVTLQTGLVSAIDHVTTGIFLNKNGAAGAVRSATVTASTYDAYGNYLVTLSATDTNTLGMLRVSFSAAASCLPVWASDYVVVTANIYDSWIAGTDVLDVSAIQILGGAIPAPVVTGVPKVDMTYGLGTIFTEGAAGRLVGGIVKFFNIATPAATMDHGILTDAVTTTTTTTNLTNAATAGDLTATMKTSVTTAVMSSVVEGSTTVVQTMRGFASALYGKCSGLATTTAVYRDAGDTKNRITATVDVDGNRSAITTDLT